MMSISCKLMEYAIVSNIINYFDRNNLETCIPVQSAHPIRNMEIQHSNYAIYISYSTFTGSMKYSFSPMTIVDWSKLPQSEQTAPSSETIQR